MEKVGIGETKRYLVRAKIDDFPSTVELELGSDRIVKSEFQITINGHIIPKNIQTQAALGSAKTYTKSQVKIGESVITDINDVYNRPGAQPEGSEYIRPTQNYKVNSIINPNK